MKIITKNKKAYFDYEIIEKFVAGVILQGHEVKSIKAGHVSLDGAYVFVQSNSALLRNAIVSPWTHANRTSLAGYEQARDRGLLLTKKQMQYIAGKRKEIRAIIVPLALGIEKNLVKLEIGLARPLRKYDKKNRKKERDEKLAVQQRKKTVETRW
jgi:SsrA-binding protein